MTPKMIPATQVDMVVEACVAAAVQALTLLRDGSALLKEARQRDATGRLTQRSTRRLELRRRAEEKMMAAASILARSLPWTGPQTTMDEWLRSPSRYRTTAHQHDD